MRPSPQQVRHWFAGEVCAESLLAQVTTLRADPNWIVVYQPGPPLWALRLLYVPTGERVHVLLERTAPLRWRAVTPTSELADHGARARSA